MIRDAPGVEYKMGILRLLLEAECRDIDVQIDGKVSGFEHFPRTVRIAAINDDTTGRGTGALQLIGYPCSDSRGAEQPRDTFLRQKHADAIGDLPAVGGAGASEGQHFGFLPLATARYHWIVLLLDCATRCSTRAPAWSQDFCSSWLNSDSLGTLPTTFTLPSITSAGVIMTP